MPRTSGRLLAVVALGLALACGRRAPTESTAKHALVAASLPPQVVAGLAWLAGQQNPDGSYGDRPTSLATPLQSTVEVIRGQLACAAGVEPTGLGAALAFLDRQSEASTELLARRVLATSDAGRPLGRLVTDLLALRNPDGGFGDRAGYSSSALETAFALQALHAAGHPAGPELSGAVAFLRAAQLPSGGWADGNELSVYTSSVALLALAPYRSTHQGAAAAVTGGQDFLLSRRDGDGLWGDDFITASALLALAQTVADLTPLQTSEAALRAHQDAQGSWA
jgi:Prenyltransferase and squalene oxidase repeat